MEDELHPRYGDGLSPNTNLSNPAICEVLAAFTFPCAMSLSGSSVMIGPSCPSPRQAILQLSCRFPHMHYLRCERSRFRRFSTANMGLNPALGLAGTTPFHNYYVMLHSRDRPREFPKVASSPVQKELQLALAPSNGLVNFSWSPQQSLPPLSSSFDEEVYSATAFSKAGSVIELEGLSLSNVQEAVRQITSPHHTIRHTDVARQLYIYVCTHAARDCRCGDTGGLVAAAFRKEIDRRGLTSAVKLGETGHVGGHKYAANVLIYPEGEWLGYVRTEDVPSILGKALEGCDLNWNSSAAPPLLPNHWRGRMGLEKERQLALAAVHLS